MEGRLGLLSQSDLRLFRGALGSRTEHVRPNWLWRLRNASADLDPKQQSISSLSTSSTRRSLCRGMSDTTAVPIFILCVPTCPPAASGERASGRDCARVDSQ